MKQPSDQTAPWRIAVVWQPGGMQGQKTFNALCQWSDLADEVTLRHFDAMAPNFLAGLAKPLQQWRPHGVILRLSDWPRLKALRRLLPEVPFVTTLLSPASLVDSCVCSDMTDAITLARDHFYAQGLQQVALYCAAEGQAAKLRTTAFQAVVPGGLKLVWTRSIPMHHMAQGRVTVPVRYSKPVSQWLKALPKPIGIMTMETWASDFLLQHCLQLGLRVPQDVQIIGIDDADVCLACTPHLTSINLPSERIGEVAIETMLRYLRGEQPPPIIQVAGSSVSPRGSTGLIHVGKTEVAAALKLMEAHACKGMSAARIAQRSGVGLTTFYEQFRLATGRTPAKVLRELRLQEACRMLRESTSDITKIAEACGFSSANYFARFFRHEIGETPTAYRERAIRG